MASPAGPTLLTIPPEMRNRIYREALVQGNIYMSRCCPFFGPLPDEPALLSVCHQIREEALSIYYCENKFSFGVYDSKAGREQYFLRCLSDPRNTAKDVGTFREQLVEAWIVTDRHGDALLRKFAKIENKVDG
ncbi:hypothetical protein LTS10_011330 [Elasticomyces elasticus]|nr:hypothetical protein LTS10_011330 [Elasticomyces elasticus]